MSEFAICGGGLAPGRGGRGVVPGKGAQVKLGNEDFDLDVTDLSEKFNL